MTDNVLKDATVDLEGHRIAQTIANHLFRDAGEIIRGRIDANFRGLCHHEGHSAAQAYVNELLLLENCPPGHGRKLKLVVSNDEDAK